MQIVVTVYRIWVHGVASSQHAIYIVEKRMELLHLMTQNTPNIPITQILWHCIVIRSSITPHIPSEHVVQMTFCAENWLWNNNKKKEHQKKKNTPQTATPPPPLFDALFLKTTQQPTDRWIHQVLYRVPPPSPHELIHKWANFSNVGGCCSFLHVWIPSCNKDQSKNTKTTHRRHFTPSNNPPPIFYHSLCNITQYHLSFDIFYIYRIFI